MTSPESTHIATIQPTNENARRIAELVRGAYETKHDSEGQPLHRPAELDIIADPGNNAYVNRIERFLDPSFQPDYQRTYVGLRTGSHMTLEGFVKLAIWDRGDEKDFSKGLVKRSEYYHRDNRNIFGLHVIAVAQKSQGYGTALVDHALQRHAGDTVKTAIDEGDVELQSFFERRGFQRTGRLGRVALGSSGVEPLHRLFIATPPIN
ncbi:MAG TPA: hypothetical protein VH144_00890 [Candidatus Saccharimonadales bacterium]|jgi:ribosomal protein S18 acetylase RimI-like enzyme|nr:hypothetical protein [Candidatus Saccharimonadales bacterium]